MEFYERVKELAKKKGKTIRDFIEGLGINYDSYNSLKRYGNLPRGDDCVKIASSLDTSVEYLVTGNPPSFAASEKDKQFLEAGRQISDELVPTAIFQLKALASIPGPFVTPPSSEDK